MKFDLSRAVEAVSLFTAVGIVISVIIYSVQFSMFGLDYIGTASLADILRDSLKLLILFLAGLLAVMPYNAIGAMRWMPDKLGMRILITFAAAVIFIALFALLMIVTMAVGGTDLDMEISGLRVGFVLAAFLATWATMFLSVNVYRTKNRSLRLTMGSAKDKIRVGLTLLLWATGSIIFVWFLMVSQMESGLVMHVEINEVERCPDQTYTAVWMGDNKAVLKCDRSKEYFVKVLT